MSRAGVMSRGGIRELQGAANVTAPAGMVLGSADNIKTDTGNVGTTATNAVQLSVAYHLDLGRVFRLQDIYLKSFYATQSGSYIATSLQFQGSINNGAWTNWQTTVTSAAGPLDFTFAGQFARYLRILETGNISVNVFLELLRARGH